MSDKVQEAIEAVLALRRTRGHDPFSDAVSLIKVPFDDPQIKDHVMTLDEGYVGLRILSQHDLIVSVDQEKEVVEISPPMGMKKE